MSGNRTENLKQLLSSGGYHLTKPRELVFNILYESGPLSMSELITATKGKVDRVSVYRTIDVFEKLGLANRIYLGWKHKIELSDDFVHHHHHLTCLKCGKTIDIEDEEHILEFMESLSKKHSFELKRHQFEIDGYCSDCREESPQTS